MNGYYIGLMSGTSMDGIDAALVEISDSGFKLIDHHGEDVPEALRQELEMLCHDGPGEIDRMGQVDRETGRLFANAVAKLLNKSGFEAKDIRAIGSHGQTIRHRPNLKQSPFSLQIGDPNTIAFETGITTVADFRRRDIAAGGQGAPLVPAFHRVCFSTKEDTAIVNIGGMANVSLLPANGSDQKLSGFDTGPGNVLMDGWIKRHKQLSHDRDGDWSRSGTPNEALVEKLLKWPYFKRPAPKSTGREEFNLRWLDQQLLQFGKTLKAENVMASLRELSSRSIAQAIVDSGLKPKQVYVCGGGALNKALMESLTKQLPNCHLSSTSELNIDPQWVEATAFAWLASQTLEGLPGNCPNVTGAKKPVVLGAIYPA